MLYHRYYIIDIIYYAPVVYNIYGCINIDPTLRQFIKLRETKAYIGLPNIVDINTPMFKAYFSCILIDHIPSSKAMFKGASPN